MAGQNYTQDCRRLAPWPARTTTPPSSLATSVRTSGRGVLRGPVHTGTSRDSSMYSRMVEYCSTMMPGSSIFPSSASLRTMDASPAYHAHTSRVERDLGGSVIDIRSLRSFVGVWGSDRLTAPPFVRHAFAFALPLSFFLNALRQSFATAAVMIHDVFFASATRVCVLRR